MAKKEIQDIDELSSAKHNKGSELLQKVLISRYKSVKKHIEGIGDKLPEAEKADWKSDKMTSLEAVIVDIANINLSNKGGTLRLKEGNKDLVDGLKNDVAVQIDSMTKPIDDILNPLVKRAIGEAEVKKAKDDLDICLKELNSIKIRRTNHIGTLRRARSYHRTLGVFFASLAGLGLMNSWGKYQLDTLLKARLARYVTNALYVSLGVSSATLLCKYKEELKYEFQEPSRGGEAHLKRK